MTILPIITIPDPVLRKISDPVERVDDAVVKLMDDMLETMYDAPGIGLAAVQVGVLKRVLVVDAAEDGAPPNPIAMANPELVALGSTTRLHEEGCLSIPDVHVEIERPANVTVRYIDRHGKEQELAAEGMGMAGRVIPERHAEGAANPGVDMLDAAQETVRRQPA